MTLTYADPTVVSSETELANTQRFNVTLKDTWLLTRDEFVNQQRVTLKKRQPELFVDLLIFGLNDNMYTTIWFLTVTQILASLSETDGWLLFTSPVSGLKAVSDHRVCIEAWWLSQRKRKKLHQEMEMFVRLYVIQKHTVSIFDCDLPSTRGTSSPSKCYKTAAFMQRAQPGAIWPHSSLWDSKNPPVLLSSKPKVCSACLCLCVSENIGNALLSPNQMCWGQHLHLIESQPQIFVLKDTKLCYSWKEASGSRARPRWPATTCVSETWSDEKKKKRVSSFAILWIKKVKTGF